MTCKWCNGSGRILVELGSSQSYACTDCGGTGIDEPDEPIADDQDDDTIDPCSDTPAKSPLGS